MTPVSTAPDAVPFLDLLLEKLLAHSVIKRVIFAVSAQYSAVQDYFGDRAYNRKIVYAVEKSPLGTGGSILNALAYTRSQEVLVLNGSTLFDLDIHEMIESHRQSNADLTVALTPMPDTHHYSSVYIDERASAESLSQPVIGFEEKNPYQRETPYGRQYGGQYEYPREDLANSGVYLLNQTLFDGLSKTLPHRFSFERDFLSVYLQQLNVYGFISSDRFIDMSVPEDYQHIQQALSNMDYAQSA